MICFKIDVMLNTAKLYSLILVWMTLIFIQVTRLWESYNLFSDSELHEAAKMFMVDYVGEVTEEVL